MSISNLPSIFSSHAFASPSTLAAIQLCPYSAKCCENWIQPPSEAAERGRLLHKAVYDDDVFNSLPDDDRLIISSIRKDFVEPCSGMEVYFELPLSLYDPDGNVITSGTLDFLAINNNVGMLNDWKFGGGFVPPFNSNPQLKAYVGAAFQKFPQLDVIFTMPVQPALGINFDLQAEVPRSDLDSLVSFVSSIVTSARNATPEDASPRSDACRWCNRNGCPAYQKAMSSALAAFNAPSLDDSLPDLPSSDLVTYCDDKLQQLDLIEPFIKDCKAAYKRVLLAAGGSANYKLTKPVERKSVDYKSFLSDKGFSSDDLQPYTTVKICEPSLIRKSKKGAPYETL